MTFGNDVEADLTAFNFDARNYDVADTINRIGIRLYKNNSLVNTQNGVVTNLTSTFVDTTVNFGSGANFSSALGSTDTFEVRVYGYQFANQGPVDEELERRIGLDNVRFIGTKVPEPSGIALLGLGLAASVARRRR